MSVLKKNEIYTLTNHHSKNRSLVERYTQFKYASIKLLKNKMKVFFGKNKKTNARFTIVKDADNNDKNINENWIKSEWNSGRKPS